MEKDKDISQMGEKELKKEYDRLSREIENIRIYDGRGMGVDIYICDRCNAAKYTRYKDKGVTPYIIHCRECGGNMVHRKTVEETNYIKRKETIKNWVRPTYEQMMKMDKGTIEHVLRGGLVLEDEIK